MSDSSPTREEASTPVELEAEFFNPDATLPYGLKVEHIAEAMRDLNQFLRLINQSLVKEGMRRLEDIAMPANFSSMVGEFMYAQIPDYCPNLVQNTYHNGFPDLIPAGEYENNEVQYGERGIEVKASRYRSGWQGHNAEECWLMVVHYNSNSPNEPEPIRPFSIEGIFIAELEEEDWSFSGRGEDSRRTITASVLASGRDRMIENYIYDREQQSHQGQLPFDV